MLCCDGNDPDWSSKLKIFRIEKVECSKNEQSIPLSCSQHEKLKRIHELFLFV